MVQTFARLDDEGCPIGFWRDDVHDMIPTDTVEIAEATWQECLANPGRRRILDGEPVVFDPPAPSPRPREATAYALVLALTEVQAAALATGKARDRARLQTRGSDPFPESNPVVGRLAGKVGMTPAAWFDAALAPLA